LRPNQQSDDGKPATKDPVFSYTWLTLNRGEFGECCGREEHTWSSPLYSFDNREKVSEKKKILTQHMIVAAGQRLSKTSKKQPGHFTMPGANVNAREK